MSGEWKLITATALATVSATALGIYNHDIDSLPLWYGRFFVWLVVWVILGLVVRKVVRPAAREPDL